jgi:hypothetical protein
MKTWQRPFLLTIAGALIVLGATGITAACDGGNLSTVNVISAGAASNSPGTPDPCERLFVPAYFSAPYWETAIGSNQKPADMILDVDGMGAGTAPDPDLQYLVKQAQAAGITVLGYSSTADAQRPVAQVETDIGNYAAWYGVTGIFLDRVSGTAQDFAYYSQVSGYIRGAHAGAMIWMNPGVYPADQDYMSLADVMSVFEGPYAQYLTLQVPGWALSYTPDRFAHTIYATPEAALADALNLAQQRNAGYVYVTDLAGPDPYQGLPSYWTAEGADPVVGCASP